MGETELTEDQQEMTCARQRREPFAAFPSKAALTAGNDLVSFDRDELMEIFGLYGRKVGSGEWRDYAIDFTPHKAVFSIYRRACEFALYRIEKTPKNGRKQGAYSVITATGLILKRGHDLGRVISILDRRLKAVPQGLTTASGPAPA